MAGGDNDTDTTNNPGSNESPENIVQECRSREWVLNTTIVSEIEEKWPAGKITIAIHEQEDTLDTPIEKYTRMAAVRSPKAELLKGDANKTYYLRADEAKWESIENVKVDLEVDNTENSEIKVNPKKWNVVLIDNEGNPLSGKKWTLGTVEGNSTDGGAIVLNGHDVSNNNVLKVTMGEAPTATAPAADPAFDPLKYPPDIINGNFKDEDPEPASPKSLEVEWEVKCDELPSLDDLKGIQIRLYNLGFGCDDGSDASVTKRAVKAFQNVYLNQKNGSGNTADIKDDLGTNHDRA